MSREAGDQTKAIRSLLDETNGNMKHSEARPRLKALGIELAPDPDTAMDAMITEFEGKFKEVAGEHDFDPRKKDHVLVLRTKTFKKLRWDDATVLSVTTELNSRDAFRNERNKYDVTKYNWRKKKESAAPTPSRKPMAAPDDPKARTAAKTGRKASEPAVITATPKYRRGTEQPAETNDYAAELSALEFVEDNGGIAAIQSKAEALKAEADELEEKLALVRKLKARVSAA